MYARQSLWDYSARLALIVFLFIACTSARLNAQGYATISGTVTDPSGAVIPSATVTTTQTLSGAVNVVKSGADGNYVFPALLPSNYAITVSASGFERYSRTGIVLQANQAVTVNISMVVGAATQTVSVSGDAPQVDTTTGTLSQVIDQDRVVDLPLNGRNAASLITLVAGVVDATNEGNGANQGNGKTFPAAVITSSNGTLPNQSNYLLDGGNNVDEMTNVNGPFPFPDALQEFSVQTSNYDAQFGQSAGAMVNIITKSGGSQFHGDAFEFLRNGFFNAESHFSPAGTQDTLHRHQFGGTIGGPVIIPRISAGKSTQFFFGYQHTLIHSGSAAAQVTVPTLAEEGLTSSGSLATYADYGNLCTAGWDANNVCKTEGQIVRNPYTNAPYTLNRIPSSDFDAASVAFEKDFPTYTGTEAAGKIGGAVNYFSATQNYYNEYVSRVDHSFSDRDHMFGRYYYNWFQQPAIYTSTMLQSYTSYFNTRYQNALLAETHSFTSNLLNNLVLNYQREVALRGGPPGSPDITSFGVQNLWQPNTGPYMAASVTNYFKVGSSAFAGWGRNNYTFNDDLHWVKGNHNFAFGGHIELSKFDVTNVYTSYGGFTFGTANNAVTVNGVKTTYQYPNAAANFLMGFMTGFGQGNFEQVNDRNHFPGIYAQDSWKATHRLTVNYGVRWEMFAPWANRNGAQTAFSPTNYAAKTFTPQFSTLPAGMVLSGDTGLPANGVKNQYKQFMPRVGFAYDIFGDGKTVVRGGFGAFYQDRLPGFFNLTQASYVPNTISVSLSNLGMYSTTPGANPGGHFSNPYCVGCSVGAYTNPFPFTLPFKSSQAFPNDFQLAEYDPSGVFRVPVTYDYNLTIERELVPSWAVRVAYVGTGSRHQAVSLELNPEVNNGIGGTDIRRVYNTAPTVGPCSSGAAPNTAGCNTSYSNINQMAMIGSAGFNSLQLTLTKRMQHGLSLLANYTWSKSLDDMPQATRVSNTEDVNPGESYVYPIYPANATNVPASAYASDVKALDRGISDIDHPNVFSVSYVYMLPKMQNGNLLLRSVVNGWRTSGLVQHHSGDSLTTYMGTDNSLTGLSQDRAQRNFTLPAYSKQAGNVGDCQAGKICVNWLNNAAFSVPAVTAGVPGTGYGNVVKGTLRGPGITVWNGALVRTFPIVREMNLEFRMEYFDVLNHTILNNPNTSNPVSSSTTFGTITGENSAGPRIGQFALKFTF